jgi:hypothetical protein
MRMLSRKNRRFKSNNTASIRLQRGGRKFYFRNCTEIFFFSGEGSRRGRGGHSADQQLQQKQQQLGGRNNLAAVPEEEETAGSSISVRWVNRGVRRVRRLQAQASVSGGLTEGLGGSGGSGL